MIEGDGPAVTMWRAVIVHAIREGDREWFDGGGARAPPAAKPLSHYEGAEQGYVLGAGNVATGWHGILARSRPA